MHTMTLMLFNGATSAAELQACGMGSSSLLLNDKVFEGFDFNPHKIAVRPQWKDRETYEIYSAKTACKPSDTRI
jgi:hypothetical protein